jgi:hypothetical protein
MKLGYYEFGSRQWSKPCDISSLMTEILNGDCCVMVLLNSERAAVTTPAAAADATNLRLEQPLMSLLLLWGERLELLLPFQGRPPRKAVTGKLDRPEYVSR